MSIESTADKPLARAVFILLLVVAGEMIFSLPFHTARFFRPTLLEVFGFSNTQLGDAFAVYGVFAMLAYFPGGVIADRFSARALISLSLMATAAGGLYMATFPGGPQMAALYGYWGITTILLFWAAIIRATREWGGARSQGKAFGILDGGRGLVAAGVAVGAVAVLALYLPADANLADDAQRRAGFRAVILLYSAATFVTGVLTWLLLPAMPAAPGSSRNPLAGMGEVLRRPLAWAQAGVIVCAYCGYKGVDNYSLYAVQVLGMDEVEGARFTAYATYLRPLAAIAAGFLADRFSAGRIIGVTFLAMTAVYAGLAAAVPNGAWLNLIYANIFVSMFGVFALRGVYFALLQETCTPKHLTGTTVGMVSFIGYTPEIFFAPITGRILDAAPGLAGFQSYFLFLSAVAAAGLAAVSWLTLLNRRTGRR